jgi:hypothetical protein
MIFITGEGGFTGATAVRYWLASAPRTVLADQEAA